MTARIKTEEHARMMRVLENRIAELQAIVVQQRDGFFEQDRRITELEKELEKSIMEGAFQIAECKILRRKLAKAQAENDRLGDEAITAARGE